MIRRILCCIFGLLALASSAFATGNLPPEIRQKLDELRSSGREILFVDVDNTLALQHNKDGAWVVYNGAVEFLEAQSAKYALVIFTSNLRPKINELQKSAPEIFKHVEHVITANDFAPKFATLMSDVEPALKIHPDPPVGEWRQLLYDTVKKNPERYLPEGFKLESFPATVPEFRKLLYIPYILPNKVPVVLEFHGTLVDDHLRANDVEAAFKELENRGQAVFEGRIGGDAANEGPDYQMIDDKLGHMGCTQMNSLQ